MSSRAFRRLHSDVDVIKLPASSINKEEDIDNDQEQMYPNLQQNNRKDHNLNPFELLLEDEMVEGSNSSEDKEIDEGERLHPPPPSTSSHRGNKRKKKKKKKNNEPIEKNKDIDEVDAAIQEVSEMLGGLETTGPKNITTIDKTMSVRNVLCVNRRYLNADNEMRRIFGSRVVRAEQSQRKDHRRKLQRPTVLVNPKDAWPLMEKLGISMELIESSDNCHHFSFVHSLDYQKIQFNFLDAVETYDPNAIGAVLHAHPYHIDSLLQLSEVCKMGEDLQMAADLIERALYHFECNFHPLFNLTQDNFRISYTTTENRSFFLALFRHLIYVERKGCRKTAFELCKLLLNLDPITDPLCVLLMIDYHALQAYEYNFLIDLYTQWESDRNLSQLPNFAFSVPLAMFMYSNDSSNNSGCGLLERANTMIQESLIMFPSVLLLLLDKCSVNVTLKQDIINHTHFSRSRKDTDALQLLIKLYIERNHLLWKIPEVLEWLGNNAMIVIKRVNERDPFILECDIKRQKRYIGTPSNISRHVILCDHLNNITTALPRDVTGTPIMMYDPLPPENSTAGYTRPPRPVGHGTANDNSNNPVMLFLQSLLPSFNTTNTEDNRPNLMGVAQQQQDPPLNEHPLLPGIQVGGGGGAVGRDTDGFALETAVQQLTTSLRGLLEQLRPHPPPDNNGNESNSETDSN